MNNHKELLYAMALQATKGIGAIRAKKMIEVYGSALKVYEAHQSNHIEKGINTNLFQQLFKEDTIVKAKKELERAEKHHLKILYYKEDTYPKYLLNCDDAPLVLFLDGTIKFNQYPKIISIVGTRNMTHYGRDFCIDLIKSLVPFNPLIVSGFAFGVDICAHTEALKNGLSTVGVLAHGFGTLYPKEHKRFYSEVKETGGFISEFNFEEPPYRENFLKRNRIVAGISRATIVVESAKKGGSLVTAELANGYNKDVFALPGRATDVYSKGCNGLIKKHMASLITEPEDLINQLGWKKNEVSKHKIIQPQLFVELEGGEKQVYDFLSDTPVHIDEISRTCGIPIYKISNVVFQLEMKHLIQVLPGKLVKKV